MFSVANVFLPIIILSPLISPVFAEKTADSPTEMGVIVVNVFDARGSAVRDLSKENFRVRQNGKPVVVLDARYNAAPRRIVVLLDMSGSMSGEDVAKWKIAREAVSDLLAHAPGDVPIAMLTFSGTIRDVFDFPQSRTSIAKWLDGPGLRPNLKYPARTALFDAILEGLRLLGEVQSGDAIYAITDGGENVSQASAEQTEAALLQSGVRLFAFVFAQYFPLISEDEHRHSFLSMVDDSGGFSFGVAGRQGHFPFRPSWTVDYAYDYDNDTREKIRMWTQGLNLQVNGFWTLRLAAPPSDKKSKIKLEIVSHEGKVRKDVGVTYPRRLPLLR